MRRSGPKKFVSKVAVQVLVGRCFDRPEAGDSRVVHQDVDLAFLAHHMGERLVDRCLRIDIELDNANIEVLGGRSLLQWAGLRQVAHRRVNAVAGASEAERGLVADACAASRDEDNRHLSPPEEKGEL